MKMNLALAAALAVVAAAPAFAAETATMAHTETKAEVSAPVSATMVSETKVEKKNGLMKKTEKHTEVKHEGSAAH